MSFFPTSFSSIIPICDFTSWGLMPSFSDMMSNFSFSTFNFGFMPEFSIGDTFVKSSKSSIARTDGDFEKMLKFVLKMEGGEKAVTIKGDRGGRTKKGIIQATYNSYRKSKGLAGRAVDYMTDDEMRDIYYNMFYKASGADKIKDARLALYVFDTAVNMGVGRAKQILKASGGNADKFLSLRKGKYNGIVANNPSQQKFHKGWNNRLMAMEKFADSSMMA